MAAVSPRHGSRSAFPALALALVCAALCATLSTALPQDSVKGLLLPAGDGSYGSLEDTYYAVSVLSAIKDPSFDASKTCAWVGAFKPTEPLELETASALARLSALVCPQAPASLAKAEASLVNEASSASSPQEIYFVAEGLLAIKSKKWNKADYGALKQAAAVLEALKLSDGTFKTKQADADGSTLAAGYALNAVAALVHLKALSADKAKDITKFARALFAKATSGANKEAYLEALPEEGGALPATSLLTSAYFSSVAALGEALPAKKETVAGMGLYLATAGAPLSLSEASLLFGALAALDSNSLVVPVIASGPGRFSLSASSGSPSVLLQTVLGRGVEGASVTLASAKLMAKGSTSAKPVAQDKPLIAKGSAYALPSDVIGASSALGTYTLKLEITPAAAEQVAFSPVTLAVTTSATIKTSPVTVAILDSDKGQPASEASVKLDAGSKAELKTLSASHLQKLRVSVSLTTPAGKPFAPHQAFLTLKHESGTVHNLLLKESGGVLTAKLDILESVEKLFYLSGVYTLTLTLGDLYMENSGTWPLGAVDLDLPEAPETAPKPKPPAASLSVRFGPQQEIAHIFRKPERRPANAVSLVFTFLTLLPLALLILGFLALGVNLNLFPSGGVPFLAALAFHGGLAAILLLYVAFWVEVKLFTTLKLLVLLALVTAVPGHYILSFLADSSAKAKTS